MGSTSIRFTDEAEKFDVSDWIDQGHTREDFQALIDESPEWFPSSKSPRILYRKDESRVNEEICRAIGRLGWNGKNEDSKVYSRAGSLVSIIKNDDKEEQGALKIHQLTEALVREKITQACELYSEAETKDGIVTKDIRPPKATVQQIKERGDYQGLIKPLAGIIHSPTIRNDGSILQQPGYDEETALFLQKTMDFEPIPDSPCVQDAANAVELLLKPVNDFPFVSDADKAAWLSCLLTMVARSCVNGCTPLFAYSANVRGVGKTLAADVTSCIAYGHPLPRRTYPGSGEELRKAVTAIALESENAVLFDNVNCRIQGAAIDAVLTSHSWKDRILGKTQSTTKIKLKTCWLATGNNISFGTDVARRVVPIRFESSLENPEERTGFEHENLLQYVQRERSALVSAALTIIRAYFNAGCPKQPGGQFGSFEAWSDIIRGAIVWTGFADPLDTKEYAKKSDESADLLGLLIAGLLEADEGEGLTAKQIETKAKERKDKDSSEPRYPILAEAIELGCSSRVTTRTIGNLLRQYKGRTFKNTRINSIPGRSNLRFWKVEKTPLVTVVTPTHTRPQATKNSLKPITHTETEANNSNHSHQRNQFKIVLCPECNAVMTPANVAVDSFINFDCDCGKVLPKKLEEVQQ